MQPLRSFEAALSSFRLSSGGEGGGAPGTQEDAEEWLGFLLDQMHEELLASARASGARAPLLPPSVAEAEASCGAEPPSDAPADADAPAAEGGEGEGAADVWQTVGKNNKVAETTRMEASDASPITCIFGGQLASRLESRGAAPGAKQNKPSITIEPFQCLNVDIKSGGVVSLEDAITGLCSPEWIDGVEMEKGQPAVRAQRQYLIRHPPPVLILHLKRFSHDAHGAHKLSKPLKFTESLTLKPTVLAPPAPSGASNGSKPSAPTYRLFAGGPILPRSPLSALTPLLLTPFLLLRPHARPTLRRPQRLTCACPPLPPQSSRTTARRCASATTRATSAARRAPQPTPPQPTPPQRPPQQRPPPQRPPPRLTPPPPPPMARTRPPPPPSRPPPTSPNGSTATTARCTACR